MNDRHRASGVSNPVSSIPHPPFLTEGILDMQMTAFWRATQSLPYTCQVSPQRTLNPGLAWAIESGITFGLGQDGARILSPETEPGSYGSPIHRRPWEHHYSKRHHLPVRCCLRPKTLFCGAPAGRRYPFQPPCRSRTVDLRRLLRYETAPPPTSPASLCSVVAFLW